MTSKSWQSYFRYTKSRELLASQRLTVEEVEHLLFVLPYTDREAFNRMVDNLLDSKRPKVEAYWNRTLSIAITYRGVTVKRDAVAISGLMDHLDEVIREYVEQRLPTLLDTWFTPTEQEQAS